MGTNGEMLISVVINSRSSGGEAIHAEVDEMFGNHDFCQEWLLS